MTVEESGSPLNAIELRVLGALMEKARTTPDIYPLTLNSLVSACNQKTSREPVTDYDEDAILQTLNALREKGLTLRVDMAGSRVAKFRENLSTEWNLTRQEYALLTLLFLRGPQTAGQLRGRSDRLFEFAEIPQVQNWLERMQDREEEPYCLVRPLPRLPGTKEIRFAHVFYLEEDAALIADGAVADTSPIPAKTRDQEGSESALDTRFAALEERVTILEQLLNDLTE